MNPLTKTYVSLGLVALALFNFFTAMAVYGKKEPTKNAKLVLRLHRVGGYTFFAYFIWISWVCFDIMTRFARAGKPLDVRGFYHGFLAFVVIAILLLKISFVRIYKRYQPHARTIGILMTVMTLVIWAIAGGMFLILLR